jgi:hypothetical protein
MTVKLEYNSLDEMFTDFSEILEYIKLEYEEKRPVKKAFPTLSGKEIYEAECQAYANRSKVKVFYYNQNEDISNVDSKKYQIYLFYEVVQNKEIYERMAKLLNLFLSK